MIIPSNYGHILITFHCLSKLPMVHANDISSPPLLIKDLVKILITMPFMQLIAFSIFAKKCQTISFI